MKRTGTVEGQAKYGNNFQTYDYFVVKHSVAVMDSRGDQLHFSDAFATGHAAFVLEFEVSLLAIDPSIGALPYWETNNGDVLTDAYFGSASATGTSNTVVDGKFANWPIEGSFSIDTWSSYLKSVAGASNGFNGNGNFLRGTSPNNKGTTTVLARFGTAWSFPASGQAGCAATPACWGEWYACIEGGSSDGNFHSGAHSTVGGKSGSALGDFMDPTTSPNDPIFMFHHANVDRNRMKWMEAHAHEASVYYGFKGSAGGCVDPRGGSATCASGGIELTDVINALWPFTSDQLGLSGLSSEGLTHADVLCYVGPASAPYAYAEPGVKSSSETTPVPVPTPSPTPAPASSTNTPVPVPTPSPMPAPASSTNTPVPVPTPSPMPAPASSNTPVPAPQSTPTSTDGAQVMWRLDLARVAAIGSVLHLSLCNL